MDKRTTRGAVQAAETYDKDGMLSPYGLYDEGGHIIVERWIESIDDARDRAKEERLFGDSK
jgi:hypothetical protein